MKGIVFTEFLDMVDDRFGFEVSEQIIEQSKKSLSTGGAYSSIGTYSHNEMFALVGSLSKHLHVPVNKLVHVFGEHLLGQFAKKYGVFFDEAKDTFTFLKSIDNHIHIEVKKLYPDAELPKFECFHSDEEPDKLTMIYSSERSMSDLAAGLMEGAIKYYGENITYTKEMLGDNSGKKVQFNLTKVK